MSTLPEHVRVNRDYWDANAESWVAAGERRWGLSEPIWGIWQVPDEGVRLLPDEMNGLRAIELGCGTGYVSAWMVRRGAVVVGIDNSERQLATAIRLAREHGAEIDFRHGNAEAVDAPDGTFDFAVSEYGAAIWCEPSAWLREAHRLLAPGGRLHFFGYHPLASICTHPDGERVERTLHTGYFDLGRIDWSVLETDPGGIEFNLTTSEWIRVFREVGFEIDAYHEVRAPAGASGVRFGVSAEWARAWPSEHAWKLTKRR